MFAFCFNCLYFVDHETFADCVSRIVIFDRVVFFGAPKALATFCYVSSQCMVPLHRAGFTVSVSFQHNFRILSRYRRNLSVMYVVLHAIERFLRNASRLLTLLRRPQHLRLDKEVLCGYWHSRRRNRDMTNLQSIFESKRVVCLFRRTSIDTTESGSSISSWFSQLMFLSCLGVPVFAMWPS